MTTLTLTDYTVSSGFALLAWDKVSEHSGDGSHYSWRIYVRRAGSPVWTLAYEETDQWMTYTYDLWQWGNGPQELVLVMVALGDDGALNYDFNPNSPGNAELSWTPAGSDSNYWFIDGGVRIDDDHWSLKVPHVKNDSFTEDYETETLDLLGRGRKVNLGERLGVTGSLSIRLESEPGKTATQQFNDIRQMVLVTHHVFMRNPYGDILRVNFSNLSGEREAGTGTREVINLDLDYTEVA